MSLSEVGAKLIIKFNKLIGRTHESAKIPKNSGNNSATTINLNKYIK